LYMEEHLHTLVAISQGITQELPDYTLFTHSCSQKGIIQA
jgi:hypothetical protein